MKNYLKVLIVFASLQHSELQAQEQPANTSAEKEEAFHELKERAQRNLEKYPVPPVLELFRRIGEDRIDRQFFKAHSITPFFSGHRMTHKSPAWRVWVHRAWGGECVTIHHEEDSSKLSVILRVYRFARSEEASSVTKLEVPSVELGGLLQDIELLCDRPFPPREVLWYAPIDAGDTIVECHTKDDGYRWAIRSRAHVPREDYRDGNLVIAELMQIIRRNKETEKSD